MKDRPLILLVSVNVGDFSLLESSIREEGYEFITVNPFSKGLRKLKKKPSLILFDLDQLDIKCVSILREIKKSHPDVPVIVLSQPKSSQIEKALRLIKEGAYDYLKKPFIVDELKILIRRAIRKNPSQNEAFPGFVLGKDPKMKKALMLAKTIAPTDLTVLIEGESGTGKEILASFIHKLSKRKGKLFLKLNCAALTESIMESELFGYERGAFTGAENKKIGLFSAAEGGTLLLDEIAEISLTTQAKLLRVIENKEFIPVGGIAPVRCDVRLIVATNKSLGEEMEKGRFRRDLFYRINFFTIYLPPLRERKEDIPLFINYFLKKYNRILNKKIEGLEDDVYALFLNYPWPGNIRELESALLKTFIICDKSIITIKDVREALPRINSYFLNNSIKPFKEAKDMFLESFEERYIKDLLLRSRGNILKAAKEAKVTRSFLYYKIKQYGINLSMYRNSLTTKRPPLF